MLHNHAQAISTYQTTEGGQNILLSWVAKLRPIVINYMTIRQSGDEVLLCIYCILEHWFSYTPCIAANVTTLM